MRASSPVHTDHEPRRRRVVWAILTLALSVAALGVSATGAVFTETDTEGGNTFATGSVDFSQSYTGTEIVSASNMAPGDTVSKAVTVSNDGSLELRYAVTSTTTEDILASQLELWVWDEADEDDTGVLGLGLDNSDCDATPGNGVSTYAYTQGILGSTGGTNVIGDPTQGSQAGDRTLAAAASEVLCFHVELPLSTDSTYEGLSTTATFSFQAEQTANNA